LLKVMPTKTRRGVAFLAANLVRTPARLPPSVSATVQCRSGFIRAPGCRHCLPGRNCTCRCSDELGALCLVSLPDPTRWPPARPAPRRQRRPKSSHTSATFVPDSPEELCPEGSPRLMRAAPAARRRLAPDPPTSEPPRPTPQRHLYMS